MQRELNTKAEILSCIEAALRSEHYVELVLTSNKLTARVYIAKGAIAWAIASGQPENFQNILINEHNFSKEHLINGVRESRKAGKKDLDDLLAALGVQNERQRRDICRRHTSAALQTVLGWGRCSASFAARAETAEEAAAGFSLKELLNDHERGASQPLFKVPTSRPTAGPERLKARPTCHTSKEFASVDELLDYLRAEIPLFRAAMIIEMRTGMPIASVAEPDLDVQAASAFYRDVVRAAAESYQAIGQERDVLEEILIGGSSDYLLLRRLPRGDQVLLIVIEHQGNPGMARIVANRYVEALAALLS